MQQLEVAVHGPDGATHLILCAGVADLGSGIHEAYTFLVGPQLSRRQFVGAIASVALSTIEAGDNTPTRGNTNVKLGANLVLIDVNYDEDAAHVKVRTQVSSSLGITKLAISYSVSILAELLMY